MRSDRDHAESVMALASLYGSGLGHTCWESQRPAAWARRDPCLQTAAVWPARGLSAGGRSFYNEGFLPAWFLAGAGGEVAGTAPGDRRSDGR